VEKTATIVPMETIGRALGLVLSTQAVDIVRTDRIAG
jgi:hypothetical protein